MSSDITLAPGLAELDSRLRAPAEEADLAQVLRALQRLRLSEADLRVHIERLRAYNDATDQDQDFEENCILALDLVTGYARGGLRWDAAATAPILLAKVLDREALEAGCLHAVRANDLLPPRPYNRVPRPMVQDISGPLVDWAHFNLQHHEYQVGRADIFRTPKSPFTTRPAALLAFPDRLAFEALAELISPRLDQRLPATVLWPRGRTGGHADGLSMDYQSRALEWDSDYIVKADIADFYGSVDHAILGLVTSTHLDMPRKYGQAVESLLSAVMTIGRGLPQGVPASDVFASAFLLPVDSHLSERSMTYLRCADDYLLPAASLDEARTTLRYLEENLREVGLSLNDGKTSIMRSSTYAKGLSEHTHALAGLVRQLGESDDPPASVHEVNRWAIVEAQFEDEEGNVWEGLLDPLWDQIYLGDLTIDDVIEDLKVTLQYDLVEAHETLLRALALELDSGPSIEIKKAEDLGRQCLAVVTADQRVVDLESLKTLLQWFPKLAPSLSVYLGAITEVVPKQVFRFIRDALEQQPKSDWVTGWLCAAIDKPGQELSRGLVRRLNSVATDPTEGLLTRTSAVHALAQTGDLSESTWHSLGTDATPAVQSEMVSSALLDPEHYPWPLPWPALGDPSLMRGLGHERD